MSHYVLPSIDQVGELFETLVGRPVQAKKGKPQFLRPTNKLTVASYKGHASDDLVGAAVFDMGVSVYASAALSMIPADGVAAAARSGVMPPNIAENLAEIFNIASQLIATADGDFARLNEHFGAVKDVPAELQKEIKGAMKKKIDVAVSISGYGDGLTSFFLF